MFKNQTDTKRNDEKPVHTVMYCLDTITKTNYIDGTTLSAIQFCHLYIFLVSFFVVVSCGFVVALLLFSTRNISVSGGTGYPQCHGERSLRQV